MHNNILSKETVSITQNKAQKQNGFEKVAKKHYANKHNVIKYTFFFFFNTMHY